MQSFIEFLSEEKVEDSTFWCNKSDAKEVEKIMRRNGIEFVKSKSKVSGMVVWDISATKHSSDLLQHDAAERDINTWLEDKRNK